MSDVRRTRGQQGPYDETRTEMARQAFDNVYTFQASGDGSSYEFSYTENGNRTFRSTGTAFCYREDDEDYYYRDEYPYDEYIMYSVYLYPEHQETNGPQQHAVQTKIR